MLGRPQPLPLGAEDRAVVVFDDSNPISQEQTAAGSDGKPDSFTLVPNGQ